MRQQWVDQNMGRCLHRRYLGKLSLWVRDGVSVLPVADLMFKTKANAALEILFMLGHSLGVY